VTQVITKAPAHPCTLQHYLQQPSHENSQDAPQPSMDQENVVFIHNRISLNHKEE
jgi:hypothetical protein